MKSHPLIVTAMFSVVTLLATATRATTTVYSNDFETGTVGTTAGSVTTTGFVDGGTLSSNGLANVNLGLHAPASGTPDNTNWLGMYASGNTGTAVGVGYNITKVVAAVPGTIPDDNEWVDLNLSHLTVGATYSVQFDLLVGGSWDGAANSYGPDLWYFSANGTRLVDTSFANGAQGVNFGAYSPQRYTDTFYSSPGTSADDVARFTGADAEYSANQDGNYALDYGIYYFGHGTGNPVLTFTASSTDATLEWARYGYSSDSADEYWALDNVAVTTDAATSTPEPGTFIALLIPVTSIAFGKCRRSRKA